MAQETHCRVPRARMAEKILFKKVSCKSEEELQGDVEKPATPGLSYGNEREKMEI